MQIQVEDREKKSELVSNQTKIPLCGIIMIVTTKDSHAHHLKPTK